MLVSFKVKNFKSFYDEALFEMETKSTLEENSLNDFDVADTSLLKSSFVYGKNAGGKSNLFKAVKKMKEIVLESFKDEKTLEVTPFLFNEAGKTEPSEFEIEFFETYNNQIQKFRYGFIVLDGKSLSEWLYRKIKRESYIFIRNKAEKIQINTSFEKDLGRFVDFVKEDSLLLSVVNKLSSNNICEIVKKFFLKVITIDSNYPDLQTIITFEKDPKLKDSIIDFIKGFDQDIENIEIRKTKIPEEIDEEKNKIAKNMWIKNGKELITVFSSHKKFKEDGNFELVEENFNVFESDGTKKLFAIATPIVYALNDGGVIFFDELDSKLHPLIVKKIISKFNSIDNNKKMAQFICNTHNPLILDDDSLMNDQFWFVNKNSKGESELYRLSDFRNVRNKYLSRKYLLGQFDAIPKI